jgi:hypothetical protein
MKGLVASCRDSYGTNASCRHLSGILFSPNKTSSINDAPKDGDVVIIRFALLNLLGDKLGSFTVLGENH